VTNHGSTALTNHGQVDMTVFFEDRVYVFEFKVIEMTEAGSALQQIKDKRYYEKYLTAPVGTDNEPVGTHGRASLGNDASLRENIYLIGVEFSRDSRNIAGLIGRRFECGFWTRTQDSE